MPEQQFFQEDEAEQILRVAASKSAPLGALSREQLIATAAELGITPEVVLAAEKQVVGQNQERNDRIAYETEKRKAFKTHLASFVCTAISMVALDLFLSNGHLSWSKWVLFFSGLAVVMDGFHTYVRSSEDYQEDFEQWRAKRSLDA